MMKYRDYQEVIKFENQVKPIKPSKASKQRKTAFKRSKNGCLTCRGRKMKCDEEKPYCKKCTWKGLDCKWPETVSTSSEMILNITPQSLQDNNHHHHNHQNINDIIEPSVDLDILDNKVIDKMLNFLDDDFVLDQFLGIESEKIIVNDREIDSNNENNDSPNDKLTIPGIELTEHELLCYNAFDKFLKHLITYPHCHPNLATSDILLPFVATSNIVREVAIACGASWLGYCDPLFEAEAIERYHNVITLIIKELKDPKSNYQDHIFVCVQLLQGLCMRNMNFGFNITLCAAHFSCSYAIIKRRFLRNTLPTISTDEVPRLVKPLDRILTENFLIFYPLNIMLCHSSKLRESVPSPFSLFGQFYHVLEEPINGFEEENVWTNHPVIGIGLKAHEIATKCCWICRFLKIPISEDDMITYFSLLVETNKELKRLSNLLRDKPHLNPTQKENIYVSRTMLYASLIILKKLCYYENTTIESLQSTVDLLLKEEKIIKERNPKGMSSIWSLFIGASTSSTIEQKKFFSKTIKIMADQLHSSICLKILNRLNIVWGDENDIDGISNNNNECIGFEFLFDTKVLDILSI